MDATLDRARKTVSRRAASVLEVEGMAAVPDGGLLTHSGPEACVAADRGSSGGAMAEEKPVIADIPS